MMAGQHVSFMEQTYPVIKGEAALLHGFKSFSPDSVKTLTNWPFHLISQRQQADCASTRTTVSGR